MGTDTPHMEDWCVLCVLKREGGSTHGSFFDTSNSAAAAAAAAAVQTTDVLGRAVFVALTCNISSHVQHMIIITQWGFSNVLDDDFAAMIAAELTSLWDS